MTTWLVGWISPPPPHPSLHAIDKHTSATPSILPQSLCDWSWLVLVTLLPDWWIPVRYRKELRCDLRVLRDVAFGCVHTARQSDPNLIFDHMWSDIFCVNNPSQIEADLFQFGFGPLSCDGPNQIQVGVFEMRPQSGQSDQNSCNSDVTIEQLLPQFSVSRACGNSRCIRTVYNTSVMNAITKHLS